MAAGGKLRLLSLVPLINRPHISNNPGIDLGIVATGRTCFYFTQQIAMGGADGKRRGHGEVGQMVVVAYRFLQMT